MGTRNRKIDRDGSGAAMSVLVLAVLSVVVLVAVLAFALT